MSPADGSQESRSPLPAVPGDEPPAGGPPGALTGVRVLDFTWSVLGPTVTRALTSFGAEVIKVEWPKRADPMRTTMYRAGEERKGLDNGPFFHNLNTGKRSLTLDVRSSRGMEIIRRLIGVSDVVIESFSSQVFRSWGLDYDELRRINPRIVYVSASGFGHSGPYETYDTWGPTAQAFNGLTSVSGLPGHPPAGWGWSYMDVAGGAMATVATLAAIHHQVATGEGQYVDVSQVEAGLSLTGPSVLDENAGRERRGGETSPPGNRAATGGSTPVYGYRGEWGAPYGAYPTLGGGHNDYCVICVLTDAEWVALREEMGRPAWALDPSLDTADGRVEQQDALDERIAAWTGSHDKYELMRTLQGAGIRCGAVQSAEDRTEHDPQLAHRGVFPVLDHPSLGEHRFEATPIRMSETDRVTPPSWPLLGRDNEYVLRDLLGMSEEEVRELDRDGLTWPADLPRDVTVSRSLW